MKKTPKLVLIRGLPGSGKSTIAKSIAGYEHIEADQFFVDRYGNYVFKRQDLQTAHRWFLHRARSSIALGDNVVVANTFTQLWELQPYLEIPGCETSVIEALGEFGNVHGVPAEAVERMRERWEEWPGEWRHRSE